MGSNKTLPGTRITKRSVVIRGHKTSISLEDVFWDGLKSVARERNQTMSALVAEIHDQRASVNLSSATRIYVSRHLTKATS